MDILGYEEIVGQSISSEDQQKMLRKLHQALEYARRTYLEHRPEDDLLVEAVGKQDYALKGFTDNIVMGWPIGKDPRWSFEMAFDCLKHFQLTMIIEGFFIRGAISFGDIYIDETVVFGKPVMDAYKGENRDARDPRIIFTQSAADEIKKHRDKLGTQLYQRDILKDTDGRLFLNYLDSVMIAEEEYCPISADVRSHKTRVEAELAKSRGNPSIWSKYAWVAKYHNDFCDQHSDEFNDEYKINF
ncbi:hypothetical protein A1355_04140 [Methylomonas koyamae]|uniref:Uncharacterized protein n=2 Tax=Methylococcaceae TaxID=403 RepID=A0A177NR80_9GAMM|nr:hypothetical protein A1355_04140 [Methylomonas koyamae]